MQYLKQSTAATVVLGPFVDDADGKTAETGLTISSSDVLLSKAGGAFAAANAGATHMSSGYYSNVLSTGNTDTLGRLTVIVSESGALPVRHDFLVLPANVYDSIVAGSDALQVHANEITNGLITAAAIATDAIDADAIADGAITSGVFAAGAINAAAIAADAIGASELAADAVTEIQSGLATASALSTLATAVDAIDDLVDTEIAAIKADTAAILLDTGTDGVVVPQATIDSIASTVAAGPVASVTGPVGSVEGDVGGNVAGSVGSIGTGGIGADTFATGAINAAAIAADAIGASELAPSAVDKIVDAIYEEARADHVELGTYGEGVASVQGPVTGSVDSVTDPVTAGTVTDKAGYSISNAGIDAIFDRTLPEAYASDGSNLTARQAFYMIWGILSEPSINADVITVKKLDGSTTAFTLTWDDADDPTSMTRTG